jgi:hypothetical protein
MYPFDLSSCYLMASALDYPALPIASGHETMLISLAVLDAVRMYTWGGRNDTTI